VLVCTSCGAENREGARFCDSCGAVLAEAAPVREVRKVVSVLFCDVSGSTALGERIDPESLRRVMARYFETAKAIVERHGGSVEKFIGDAVIAVFGVPQVREDDALRAVRSADELRGGLAELNDELETQLRHTPRAEDGHQHWRGRHGDRGAARDGAGASDRRGARRARNRARDGRGEGECAFRRACPGRPCRALDRDAEEGRA